jgi:hypothetical protein
MSTIAERIATVISDQINEDLESEGFLQKTSPEFVNIFDGGFGYSVGGEKDGILIRASRWNAHIKVYYQGFSCETLVSSTSIKAMKRSLRQASRDVRLAKRVADAIPDRPGRLVCGTPPGRISGCYVVVYDEGEKCSSVSIENGAVHISTKNPKNLDKEVVEAIRNAGILIEE